MIVVEDEKGEEAAHRAGTRRWRRTGERSTRRGYITGARVIVYFIAHDNTPTTSKDLAESLGIDRSYARRICREMATPDVALLAVEPWVQDGVPETLLYSLREPVGCSCC